MKCKEIDLLVLSDERRTCCYLYNECTSAANENLYMNLHKNNENDDYVKVVMIKFQFEGAFQLK